MRDLSPKQLLAEGRRQPRLVRRDGPGRLDHQRAEQYRSTSGSAAAAAFTAGHSGAGEPMPVIRNSVLIKCTPEQAFDYLSDLRAELEWNPSCERMEKLTDGPVGLGTRYRAKWKQSPQVELETIDYDRPHNWTMHNGGPVEVTFSCRLEPVGAGETRLHADFEPKPHGWFGEPAVQSVRSR